MYGEKRFRFVYGETHDKCMFADDVKREYILSESTLINMLNEYDIKYNLMKDKLEELGFKLIFLLEDYDMVDKKFKRKYVENPDFNDDGEWSVVSKEEFESIILKV